MNRNKSHQPQKILPLNKQEMMQLRAACLMRGTSLHRWVLMHRKDVCNAFAELRGIRNHPKAIKFRGRVREEFAI